MNNDGAGAGRRRAVARGQTPSAPAGCPHAWRRLGRAFAGRSRVVAVRFRAPRQELRQLLNVLELLQEVLHFRTLDHALLEPALDPPVQRGGRFFQMLRYRRVQFRILGERCMPQSCNLQIDETTTRSTACRQAGR